MPVTPVIPCQSVCTPWALTTDICEPCSNFAYDPTIMATMLGAASDILFQLSGRQFAGSCQSKIQPDPRMLNDDFGRPIRPWWPGNGGYGYVGGWPGYSSPFGPSRINQREGPCAAVPAVTLGVWPLTGIEEVKIDGQIVDPATYAIQDNYWLVRKADPATGNNDGWPSCNRLDLDDTHVGTWSVKFDYGMPPPPLGVLAAAELACQLYLATNPGSAGACQLPQRVTSITRQGVAVVIADPQKLLDGGGLGLRLCDMFLSTVNPAKLKRRATCMSPDLRRRSHRWTTT